MSAAPTPPLTYRPGTIIRARRRLWRVDRQDQDVLLATTIDGGGTEQHQFYLGHDDRHQPFEHIEHARLASPDPARVGFPASQDLLLRAYRLSLLHGAAPLLSLQRSRVVPTNYQLVPVAMALEEPRVRLAIFDDVGLGKTIEAGLIVTELLARQMAARVLIICPANLREQWREQLSYFFHLDEARIISTRHLREMERALPAGANAWEYYPYLIVSEDYAKTAAVRQRILEQPWDIVVIDEAHTLAKPHQSTPDERVDMERWHLAQAVATSPRVRHLLLLTATPHNGYSDSFASLLRLLDVGAVEGHEHAPFIHREIAQRHVCQRTRRDLRVWFEREGRADAFPQREQLEQIIRLNATEEAAIEAVRQYGQTVLEDAQASPRRIMAYWAVMHLHKRALSSPEALRCSLRNRYEALKRRLAATADPETMLEALSEGDALSEASARANALDHDPGERLDEDEAGNRIERGLYFPAQRASEALRAELAHLERVIALAEKVGPRQDSKLQEVLRNQLRPLLLKHPRVIIFTRYRDTMRYIVKHLEDETKKAGRFEGVAVVSIDGSLSERQRREAFARFETAASAVLVATDAISEGINLQHACCQMIHWELPWNPNRLEQRVGRIDRFGQREPVVRVRLLVMDDTLDALILKALVQKAARIREDYGFAPPYFGDDESILDLLRDQGIRLHLAPKQLSLFEENPHPSPLPSLDPFAERTIERIQAESFYGATEISVPAIERRLHETYATVGSPAQVREFVLSGLRRFGCAISEHADKTLRLVISEPNLRVESVPDVIEHATFDPQVALDDPQGVLLLDLGHPLVRRLLDVVKDGAFQKRGDHYGRTAALVTPDVTRVTALLHLLARYAVGTTPPTVIEELVSVAFPVYATAREALDRAETEALARARPSPQLHPEDEISEALGEALAAPELEALARAAVEARRDELAADRRAMLTRETTQEAAAQRRWLAGIADLSVASFDVLTATIYIPEVR